MLVTYYGILMRQHEQGAWCLQYEIKRRIDLRRYHEQPTKQSMHACIMRSGEDTKKRAADTMHMAITGHLDCDSNLFFYLHC
jgi:hypothetical protein